MNFWAQRFRRLISRISSSARMRAALLTSVFSSVGNLFISLVIVRQDSLAGVGQFAIAMSAYAISTGAIRSAVSHSVLVDVVDPTLAKRGAAKSSLLGLLAGVAVLFAALLLNLPYLIAVGFAIHGLVIFDYSKTIGQTIGNARVPLLQEVCWKSIAIGGGVLGLFGVISPLVAFIVWAVSGALVGYVFVAVAKVSVFPRWNRGEANTGSSLLFGVDYLAGSGVAQATTWVVAAVAGAGVVGGIRAAGTIMGPINIVISAVEALVLRYLAVKVDSQLRAAVNLATALGLTVSALSGLVLLIPAPVGVAVFGENWNHARPLLLPLAVELTWAVVTSVAYSGLRSLRAAGRSVIIRFALIPVRLGLIVWSVINFGALGAVWAMALVAMLGAISYWATYIHRLRQGHRT